jgi:hypothetical protein
LNYLKPPDCRKVMDPLNKLAHETGCLIVSTNNLNKMHHDFEVHDGQGAVPINAVPRVVLLASKLADPDGFSLRAVKYNIAGPRPEPLRFEFVPVGKVARVKPVGAVPPKDAGVTDALVEQAQRAEFEDAKAVLLEELHDGPKRFTEIHARMESAGVSKYFYRLAKESLGVWHKQGYFHGNRGSFWGLPGQKPPQQ